jgi:glycosyltransferase involved in cell wall biosynthesis
VSKELTVSIIVPCYNEVGTIEKIIRAVLDSAPKDKEIIVVDDGSVDGTREILKSCIESQVCRVIYHDRNRGKGAAVRSGLTAASHDVVIIQDADLEYDPKDYLRLLEPIRLDKAEVVYGSRFAGGEPHRVLYFWHSVGNKLLTFISNMFTNLNLTDMETGHKVFRREVLQRITIEEDRFGFEPEVTAKIAKLRCRIYEVGISYSGRTYEEGKKIGWKDGLWTIWCIFKYNLRPLSKRVNR